ncbi:MAG: acyl carrier protein [Desulfovibrionaceae bacterium]|nr:acyl carrier protein [Desulfovibrionaceae bacterium]
MDAKLQKLLADIFGIRESALSLDTTREDVDSWDSLKQMDLIISLEKAYAISLEIQDIVALQSVKDIVRVLKEKGVSLEN